MTQPRLGTLPVVRRHGHAPLSHLPFVLKAGRDVCGMELGLSPLLTATCSYFTGSEHPPGFHAFGEANGRWPTACSAAKS